MATRNSQIWLGVASAVFVTFLGFTVHRIYIHQPEVFATKTEVKELKGDLCDRLNDMKSLMAGTNEKLDWLIKREMNDNSVR
jgi:hypothetical protein